MLRQNAAVEIYNLSDTVFDVMVRFDVKPPIFSKLAPCIVLEELVQTVDVVPIASPVSVPSDESIWVGTTEYSTLVPPSFQE